MRPADPDDRRARRAGVRDVPPGGGAAHAGVERKSYDDIGRRCPRVCSTPARDASGRATRRAATRRPTPRPVDARRRRLARRRAADRDRRRRAADPTADDQLTPLQTTDDRTSEPMADEPVPAAPHHAARRRRRDRQEHVRVRVRRRHRRHRLRPDVPRRGDVRHRPRRARRHLPQGAPRQRQGVPDHARARGPRRRAAVRPARVPGRADLRVARWPAACWATRSRSTSSTTTRCSPSSPATRSTIGPFTVVPFRIGHSIPDAMGIALRTPVGTIVHTGDFKFDHTPVDGKLSDFHILARLGAEGVLCLLSDSTRAENPGYTPSERTVGEAFREIMERLDGPRHRGDLREQHRAHPAGPRRGRRHSTATSRSSAGRWSRTRASRPTSAT